MRIEFIDGLRGLFAMLIILHHYDLVFFQISPPDTYNFFIGVCGFFIINGFVLGYKFWQVKSVDYLTSVALRRYLRLTVLPLCSILLVYIFLKCHFIFLHELPQFLSVPAGVTAFYSFAPHLKDALYEGFWGMYFAYDQVNSYNPVLWTMQYSLKGSFLAMAFLALFGRLENRTPIYLIFAALTILLDVGYFSFLFGIWLSDELSAKKTAPEYNNFLMFALAAAGFFLSLYSLGTSIHFYDRINFPLFDRLRISAVVFYHTLGTAIFIFAVARADFLRKFFALKIFTKVGGYSFSVYVLHIPILFSVGGFIFLRAMEGGVNFAASVIISSVAAIAATAFAVIFLHHFVDLPVGRLIKRVDKIFH